MSERLNLEIVENGKVLANSYYHCVGYTSSSLGLTQEVLNNVDTISFEDRVVNAIKLLEVTGTGLTEEENQYVLSHIPDAEKYKFKSTTSRYDGLLAISEKGIEQNEYWEEHRVVVDLIKRTVDFGAVWYFDKEEYERGYNKKCDYPFHNIDLTSIPFDRFSEINELIYGLIQKGIYGIMLKDNTVCTFVGYV